MWHLFRLNNCKLLLYVMSNTIEVINRKGGQIFLYKANEIGKEGKSY